jgi:hypothetical protein
MRQFAANVLAGLAVTILSGIGAVLNVDVGDVARWADAPRCGVEEDVREVALPVPDPTLHLTAFDGPPRAI